MSSEVWQSGNTEVYDPEEEPAATISFSWWLAVLLILFGISSWVAINGLWTELPLLVNVLPEGWSLPAYLSIIIQLSNVGPLLYVLLTQICRTLGRGQSDNFLMHLIQPPERLANYSILIIGLLASILLTKFWDAVVMVPTLPPNDNYGGSSTDETKYGHSLGLFLLTFGLGLIDCMSSVTFLAYLANMPSVFAGALLFGETTSGLLPSLYALAQGISAKPTCLPSTDENGTTSYTPVYPPPNFSVSVYMGLIALTTGVSLVAFFLLDCLPSGLGRSVTLTYQRHHSLPPANDSADNPTADTESKPEGQSCTGLNAGLEMAVSCMTEKRLYWICLLLSGYSSSLTNGLLPSLQSFSTAAYGTLTFHLAVTLSGITASLVALTVTAAYGHNELGFWLRSVVCCCHRRVFVQRDDNSETDEIVSQHRREVIPSMDAIEGGRLALILCGICLLGSLFAGYIIFLACASPSPPQLGGAGPVLAVLAWILMTASFNVQKTWITLHLVRHASQRRLRTLGFATQIGSAGGAVISFLLTAIFNVFVAKPACP